MDEVKEILPSVDNTELNEDDDLYDVVSALEPVKARWQEIALGLRLKQGDVDAIKSNHDTPAASLREVEKLFLTKNYNTQKFGPPTWRRLVEVVGNPVAGQRPDLALKIAREHSLTGSVPSSESATAAAIPAVVTKPTAAVFAARPTLQQLNRLKYIDASGEKKDIRVLTAAASKWWDLGAALGYGPDVLNIIKDSEQMNPKRCLQQLISTWFQSGKKDSWEAFLEALEDAELDRLAEDIRKALPTMITD